MRLRILTEAHLSNEISEISIAGCGMLKTWSTSFWFNTSSLSFSNIWITQQQRVVNQDIVCYLKSSDDFVFTTSSGAWGFFTEFKWITISNSLSFFSDGSGTAATIASSQTYSSSRW